MGLSAMGLSCGAQLWGDLSSGAQCYGAQLWGSAVGCSAMGLSYGAQFRGGRSAMGWAPRYGAQRCGFALWGSVLGWAPRCGAQRWGSVLGWAQCYGAQLWGSALWGSAVRLRAVGLSGGAPRYGAQRWGSALWGSRAPPAGFHEQRSRCRPSPCYSGVDCMETYEHPGFRCGPCPAGMSGNGTHCADIDEVRGGGGQG